MRGSVSLRLALAFLLGAAISQPAKAEPTTRSEASTTEQASRSEVRVAEQASHFLQRGSVRLGRSGVAVGYAPGYGKEDLWFALDTDISVKLDHAGGVLGLRLHSDVVEIRSGALLAYSFRRSFLPLRDSYRRQDAELRRNDEHAFYGGITTQVALDVSVFGGNWHSETEAVGVFGLPGDSAVYVEHLEVVHHGSYLLRQRLGATWPWPSLTALRLGGALELLALPSRDATVWRVGPVADLTLSPSWSLAFELLPVVSSPDTLGLSGGVFDLTLAYRFGGDDKQ